jgi:hypothetical protein
MCPECVACTGIIARRIGRRLRVILYTCSFARFQVDAPASYSPAVRAAGAASTPAGAHSGDTAGPIRGLERLSPR